MPESPFENHRVLNSDAMDCNPAADEVRAYILDMLDQLSSLADQHGEQVLSAMLTEVARRQKIARYVAVNKSTPIPRL